MEQKLEEIRHSTAHVLAQAVGKLFKNVKFGIGPVIENGFYYDFDLDQQITEEDLKKIEEEMKKIIKEKQEFIHEPISKAQAIKMFEKQSYKLQLIEEISEKGESLSYVQNGPFKDFCRGGHVKNTSQLGNFKLQKISGAYWKGDSKNKQMQRIYGTAWSTKEELDNYLKLLEEAKKRDHRILGEKLGLLMFHEFTPGAAFFLPKGAIIYNELLKLIREEYKKRDYKEVITPLLYEKGLWETSGHWEHYKENMFNLESEKKTFSLKPMNCPSHCLIFKNKLWSYRELPLRIADFAPLHRNEITGTLSGLTRVRKFSQDDAHIFITEDQLEKEMDNLLDFEKKIYNQIFKLNYSMTLGTRPENFMGDPELWDKAEKILEEILKKKNIPYTVSEKDGAFYGPKIDLKAKDALNREWQLATIQLDFQLPRRFELEYTGNDDRRHTPIMIHRAIYGSIERFMALIIEHYAGKFPVWLSPVQVVIMTVADRHIEFAEEIAKELKENNIRVEVDLRTESIGKKVRDNINLKVPYLLTIGDKELGNDIFAIRTRENNVIELSKEEFIKKIIKEIEEKC